MQKLLAHVQHLSDGCQMVIGTVEDVEGKALQTAASHLLESLPDPTAVVIGSEHEERLSFAVAFSPSLTASKLHAGKFVSGTFALSSEIQCQFWPLWEQKWPRSAAAEGVVGQISLRRAPKTSCVSKRRCSLPRKSCNDDGTSERCDVMGRLLFNVAHTWRSECSF